LLLKPNEIVFGRHLELSQISFLEEKSENPVTEIQHLWFAQIGRGFEHCGKLSAWPRL